MVNINIHIPEPLHKQLKLSALRSGTSLKEYITSILLSSNQSVRPTSFDSRAVPVVNINISIEDALHKRLKMDALLCDVTLKAHIINLLADSARNHDTA